jgi:sec-independent protein translocase protein TatC
MSGEASEGARPAAAPVEQRMSFFAHLRELRRRIVYCLVGVFIAALVCMNYAPELFAWLRQPLEALPRQRLIVLSPLELYITYLKLALLASVFVCAPLILYQMWRFVAPGLYSNEKRWIAPFVILGTLFFVGGGAFAFYVVLPVGFKYVMAMMPETIDAQFSVALYFSLTIDLMLAFGVVFELPLVMWILSAAGIVNPKTYSRIRRYWIVVAFIVAAILTPPDPFTQCLMAVPLLLFFEAGVIGGRLLYRGRRAKALSPMVG